MFDQAYAKETGQMIAGATQLTPELRIEVGKRGVAATKVGSADGSVRAMAQAIGSLPEWPSQALKLAAGDVADGSIRYFDKTQGIAIEWALAVRSTSPVQKEVRSSTYRQMPMAEWPWAKTSKTGTSAHPPPRLQSDRLEP